MSSHENDDLERIRQTVGREFEFSPVDETLSDSMLKGLSVDAKAPGLSALKRQRLGVQEESGHSSTLSDAASREDLFDRFTTGVQNEPDAQVATYRESVKNRVYLKKAKSQSDLTEAFAAKPVVVSGTTGKITERG